MEFELDLSRVSGKIKQRRISFSHSYRVKIQIDCRVTGTLILFCFTPKQL